MPDNSLRSSNNWSIFTFPWISQNLLTFCFNQDPLQLLIGLLNCFSSLGALLSFLFLLAVHLLKKLGLWCSLISHGVASAICTLIVWFNISLTPLYFLWIGIVSRDLFRSSFWQACFLGGGVNFFQEARNVYLILCDGWLSFSMCQVFKRVQICYCFPWAQVVVLRKGRKRMPSWCAPGEVWRWRGLLGSLSLSFVLLEGPPVLAGRWVGVNLT